MSYLQHHPDWLNFKHLGAKKKSAIYFVTKISETLETYQVSAY